MKALAIVLLIFTGIQNSHAIPINTNVALPVAKNHTVFRIQNKIKKINGADESHTVILAIAHGLTEKDVLIFSIPQLVTGSNKGFGDTTFLVRHTVYKYDAPLLTSRVGVMGGIKLPTGKDQITTESTDWRIGAVYTLQSDRHEIDTSILYAINTEAEGSENGDILFHDVAYQLRLYPWTLPDVGVPSQFNFVIEANGEIIQKNEINGIKDDNSGGYKLFASAGFQWVEIYWIAEVLFQTPLVQDLNGVQLNEKYRAIAGIRFQF